MTYKEITHKLITLGCKELLRKGKDSHRKWINPSSNQGTVIPDWGSKDLKEGTIYAILK